jgi:hypothetical protein
VTWDQWTILLLGPTAVALSMCAELSYRRWGPVLGILGQGAWFYTLIAHEQWGGVIAGVAYSTSWAYGLYTLWMKESKCTLRNLIDRLTSLSRSAGSTTKSFLSSARTHLRSYLQSRIEHIAFSSGYVRSTLQATLRSGLSYHRGR